MLELKLQCDCGQKYKFDVAPVNGRMPFTVKCPICGLDGTGKANALLQKMPEYSVAQPAAPLPISAESTAPPPIGPVSQRFPAAAAQAKPGDFLLGVVGAIAGGVSGMFIWLFLCKATGLRLGFLAIGVGALTGYGAKWLGRCHGVKMGLIALVCALACIIGVQYITAAIDATYAEELAAAKTILQAVPDGTDEEIRAYLARETVEGAEKPDPNLIPADAIREFREMTWQKMKDLDSGKTTKEQYEEQRHNDVSNPREEVKGTLISQIINRGRALGMLNIFSIVIGAGVACKLGTGET
jgi:hypothetical protein